MSITNLYPSTSLTPNTVGETNIGNNAFPSGSLFYSFPGLVTGVFVVMASGACCLFRSRRRHVLFQEQVLKNPTATSKISIPLQNNASNINLMNVGMVEAKLENGSVESLDNYMREFQVDQRMNDDIPRLKEALVEESSGTGSVTLGGSKMSNVLTLPGYKCINIQDLDIGKKIGDGGVADVREGIYKGSKVAIKVLKQMRKQQNMRFEIAIMNLLGDHPNVVGLIAYYDTPEFAIVMKKYRLSLSNYIVQRVDNRPSIRSRVKLILQVARGLGHIHGKGIVHFDIKPKNILLDVNADGNLENAAICDFGIARVIGDAAKNEGSQKINIVKGLSVTPDDGISLKYASPEFLADMEKIFSQSFCLDEHKKIDVYAFSITMWETLTFTPAWIKSDGESVMNENEIIEAHLMGESPNIEVQGFPESSDPKYSFLLKVMKDGTMKNHFERPSIDDILNFFSSSLPSHSNNK